MIEGNLKNNEMCQIILLIKEDFMIRANSVVVGSLLHAKLILSLNKNYFFQTIVTEKLVEKIKK